MTPPNSYPHLTAHTGGTRRRGPTLTAIDPRERGMSLTHQPDQPAAVRRRGERIAIIVAALVVIIAAIGIAVILTGKDEPAVAPPQSLETATPSPSTTPSAEEVAAREAEARYRAFVQIDNTVARGGYVDLAAYKAAAVSPELRNRQLAGRIAASRKERQTGDVMIASLTMREVDLAPVAGDYPKVVFSACVDVSAVDIVDRAGKSLVSPERKKRYASTVTLLRYAPGTAGAERGGWFVYRVTAPDQSC